MAYEKIETPNSHPTPENVNSGSIKKTGIKDYPEYNCTYQQAFPGYIQKRGRIKTAPNLGNEALEADFDLAATPQQRAWCKPTLKWLMMPICKASALLDGKGFEMVTHFGHRLWHCFFPRTVTLLPHLEDLAPAYIKKSRNL